MNKVVIIGICVILLTGGLYVLSTLNTNRTVTEVEPSQPSQTSQTIEDFISQNISDLSPEKEVLGGKFYVTNIQVENGKGVVEYEDGHIALTADFTYEADDSGDWSVTSFDIR